MENKEIEQWKGEGCPFIRMVTESLFNKVTFEYLPTYIQ